MNLSVLATLVAIGLPMLLTVLVIAIAPFFLLGLGGCIYYGTKKRLGTAKEAKDEEEPKLAA